jgi:hypothetical protein
MVRKEVMKEKFGKFQAEAIKAFQGTDFEVGHPVTSPNKNDREDIEDEVVFVYNKVTKLDNHKLYFEMLRDFFKIWNTNPIFNDVIVDLMEQCGPVNINFNGAREGFYVKIKFSFFDDKALALLGEIE